MIFLEVPYTNIEELKKVAWFEGNSQLNEKEQTHEVGALQANDVGWNDTLKGQWN